MSETDFLRRLRASISRVMGAGTGRRYPKRLQRRVGKATSQPGGRVVRPWRPDSKVIILLHEGSAAISKEIDTIRDEYKQRFNQESVLRIDAVSCVAF